MSPILEPTLFVDVYSAHVTKNSNENMVGGKESNSRLEIISIGLTVAYAESRTKKSEMHSRFIGFQLRFDNGHHSGELLSGKAFRYRHTDFSVCIRSA